MTRISIWGEFEVLNTGLIDAEAPYPMPFEKSRYPDNWDDISLSIRTEANWTCQGCGLPCRRTDEPWTQYCERMGWNAFDPSHKRGHYVLTVAHLDQSPQNCDHTNLKALCTVCHLRYDSRFRAKQKRLIAEFHGQQRIDDLPIEGLQLSLLSDRVAPFSLPLQGKAPREGKLLSPLEQGLEPVPSGRGDRSVDKGCSGGEGRRKHKRHTPKGSASGWIEKRIGNRKRVHPTVSYYYRWDEPEDRGSVYLPVAVAPTVKRMVEVERQPVSKVMEFIQSRKKIFVRSNVKST